MTLRARSAPATRVELLAAVAIVVVAALVASTVFFVVPLPAG